MTLTATLSQSIAEISLLTRCTRILSSFLALIMTDCDTNAKRTMIAFLTSFGCAAPSFFLSLCFRLLDRYLSRLLDDRRPQAEGADSSSDDSTIVDSLSFAENSVRLCQLIELVMQRQPDVESTHNSASPLTATAADTDDEFNSSHHFHLCFIATRRLHSTALSLLHPMLLCCMWRLMQLQSREAAIGLIDQLTAQSTSGSRTQAHTSTV